MSVKCPWCANEYDSSLSKCPKCGQVKVDRSIYEYGMTLGGDTISNVISSFDVADPDKNEEKIKHLMAEAEKWAKDQEEYIPGPKKKILHVRDDGDLEERFVREKGFTNVIKADMNKVVECWIEAAKLGSLPAVIRLVETHYSSGVGVTKSVMNTLARLCAAAKYGTWGRKHLINGMEDKLSNYKPWVKCENGHEVLTKFAESGYAWAKCALSAMLRTRNGLCEINYKRSAELMNDAATAEPIASPRALAYVAVSHFDGVFGKEKSTKKAFEILYSLSKSKVAGSETASKILLAKILNRTNLGAADGRLRAKDHTFTAKDIHAVMLDNVGLAAHPHGAWTQYTPDIIDGFNRYRFFPFLKKIVLGYKKRNQCAWIHVVEKSDTGKIADITGETNEDCKKHTVGDICLGKIGLFGTKGVLLQDYNLLWNIGPVSGTFGPLYESNWLCVIFRKDDFSSADFSDWDFSGTGFEKEQFADLLNFIRRRVWQDRKEGYVLDDGTKQTGKENRKSTISGTQNGSKNHAVKEEDKKTTTKENRKKRWLFILIGIFFGILGLHFLYARRKGWF